MRDSRRLTRMGSMACASVVVKKSNGDHDIGAAFHIGDGLYLTARHVVDGHASLLLSPETQGHLYADELRDNVRATRRLLNGKTLIYSLDQSKAKIVEPPIFHTDPSVDVAILKTDGLDPDTPYFPIGTNCDDIIDDLDWLLTTGVVFGYPPIPFACGPHIVVDRITINALPGLRKSPHLHYIVSGVPHGGFSGGPAFHEYGFLFGMITEALEDHRGDRVERYLAILGVDPIWEMLEHHNLLPACQRYDEETEVPGAVTDQPRYEDEK